MLKLLVDLIHTIMNAMFSKGTVAEVEAGYNPVPVSELNDDYYDDSGRPPEVPEDLYKAIQKFSLKYQLPVGLLISFAFVESSFRKDAYRFESKIKQRLLQNPKYQGLPEPEINWASSSHSYFQCLGCTAVDLGFQFINPLEIYEVDVITEIASYYIRKLFNHYKNWEDTIVSYNSGRPYKKADGTYINQDYLNKVLNYWELYKQKVGE